MAATLRPQTVSGLLFSTASSWFGVPHRLGFDPALNSLASNSSVGALQRFSLVSLISIFVVLISPSGVLVERVMLVVLDLILDPFFTLAALVAICGTLIALPALPVLLMLPAQTTPVKFLSMLATLAMLVLLLGILVLLVCGFMSVRFLVSRLAADVSAKSRRGLTIWVV